MLQLKDDANDDDHDNVDIKKKKKEKKNIFYILNLLL